MIFILARDLRTPLQSQPNSSIVLDQRLTATKEVGGLSLPGVHKCRRFGPTLCFNESSFYFKLCPVIARPYFLSGISS